MRKHPRPRLHPARFRVRCAIIQACHPRPRNGCGTHRTWLQRHIKVMAAQTLTARNTAPLADHQHLRMGGRIMQLPHPVARTRHHAARPNQNCTNGNLAPPCRRPRLLQRQGHIGCEPKHDSSLAPPRLKFQAPPCPFILDQIPSGVWGQTAPSALPRRDDVAAEGPNHDTCPKIFPPHS